MIESIIKMEVKRINNSYLLEFSGPRSEGLYSFPDCNEMLKRATEELEMNFSPLLRVEWI